MTDTPRPNSGQDPDAIFVDLTDDEESVKWLSAPVDSHTPLWELSEEELEERVEEAKENLNELRE